MKMLIIIVSLLAISCSNGHSPVIIDDAQGNPIKEVSLGDFEEFPISYSDSLVLKKTVVSLMDFLLKKNNLKIRALSLDTILYTNRDGITKLITLDSFLIVTQHLPVLEFKSRLSANYFTIWKYRFANGENPNITASKEKGITYGILMGLIKDQEEIHLKSNNFNEFSFVKVDSNFKLYKFR